MVLSVLPLVVICLTLSAVLLAGALRIAHERAPATATALGQVLRDGEGREGLQFWWVDRAGEHRGRLVFPDVGRIPGRTPVLVHYSPADPSVYYVFGDEQDLRLRNLVSGLQFTLLVLVVGVLTTAFRLWRRVMAGRRPARTFPVRLAHHRRGLIRRSWLVIEDAEREWWVPVYWEPAEIGRASCRERV